MIKEYMHTANLLSEVEPVRPDFAGRVGFEDRILPALLAGADGTICSLSNIARSSSSAS